MTDPIQAIKEALDEQMSKHTSYDGICDCQICGDVAKAVPALLARLEALERELLLAEDVISQFIEAGAAKIPCDPKVEAALNRLMDFKEGVCAHEWEWVGDNIASAKRCRLCKAAALDGKPPLDGKP